MVLLDSERRIIAVFGGRPKGAGYDRVVEEANILLARARREVRLTKEQEDHKRGKFGALACGASHGTGRTVRCSSTLCAPHSSCARNPG